MSGGYTPEEALRDAAAAQERTAARSGTGWQHYALEGIGAALVVGGVALTRGTWTLVTMAAGLAVVLVAARTYRARRGVWPRFRGAARGVQITWATWVATYLLLLGAALWVREAAGDAGAAGWGLAVATLLALPAIGLAFDAQIRKEARTVTR